MSPDAMPLYRTSADAARSSRAARTASANGPVTPVGLAPGRSGGRPFSEAFEVLPQVDGGFLSSVGPHTPTLAHLATAARSRQAIVF